MPAMAIRFANLSVSIFILLVCLCQSGFSANSSELINTLMTTELESPSSNQQDNFKNALGQVLIKATGNLSIMTLPIIRASLNEASNMVKSYSTLQNPSSPSQTLLEVSFDPKAITQLLTSAGQPLWDAERPITLIWLSTDDSNEKNTIIDNDAASIQPVAVALKNSAQLRGLSMFFPMLDLQDQSLISSNINNTSPLTTADMQALADRYHVQSVLSGTLTQIGNQWQTQWRYLLNSAPINWSQDASSTQDTAKQVIDTVASTMIAQLAISTTSGIQTEAYLTINQVNNLQMYGQLSHCLSSLSNMNSLSPVNLNENQVTFHAKFNGASDLLIQTVTKQCQLTFQAAQNNTTPNATLAINNQPAPLPVLSFIHVGSHV